MDPGKFWSDSSNAQMLAESAEHSKEGLDRDGFAGGLSPLHATGWLAVRRRDRSFVEANGYLTSFQETAAAWPAFISSAFPRFHDIYQKAGIRDYWGYLGDRGGDTLRGTLRRALTNKSVVAQIVTWNDYGEGTVVEPTVENGYRDLGIIQEVRREHLDPGFSHGTNDLVLARRVYDLRRKHAANAEISARLDEVFLKIRDNDLAGARKTLAGLEVDAKAAH